MPRILTRTKEKKKSDEIFLSAAEEQKHQNGKAPKTKKNKKKKKQKKSSKWKREIPERIAFSKKIDEEKQMNIRGLTKKKRNNQ